MGGGTWCLGLFRLRPCGLSPRGRGNLPSSLHSSPQRRSIPAWAGEPPTSRPSGANRQVYPRVGGGTVINSGLGNGPEGLSPRGRGNRNQRMRGNFSRRSIPAWAGEPAAGLVSSDRGRVYPRVGGGTPQRVLADCKLNGLSPRGRGNLLTLTYRARRRRSIPAWAGEPGVKCNSTPPL